MKTLFTTTRLARGSRISRAACWKAKIWQGTFCIALCLLAGPIPRVMGALPAWESLVGDYQAVGVDPDTRAAYQGACRIRIEGEKLVMRRSIGGQEITAGASLVKTDGSELPSLRVRFEKNAVSYEILYVIHADLDRGARLSGNYYRRDGEERLRGVETLFSKARRDAGERVLEKRDDAGAGGDTEEPTLRWALTQLRDIRPEAAPPSLAAARQLNFCRKHIAAQWKDKEFLRDYMLQARDSRSFRELELLALLALNAGLVDAGFSTLDVLYVSEGVRPSREILERLPDEFAKRTERAARSGWQGVWLLRGTAPFRANPGLGLEKLRYGARMGHRHSRRWCRLIGVKP